MAREFKTEKYFDKVLQDENVKKSLRALKPLLYDSKGATDTPSLDNENGALWLDKNNSGELKYLNNGKWDTVFKDKFALIDQVMEPRPLNPVYGQFWIDKENQILMYYDGTTWKDVRAVQSATEYSTSFYKDFLMLGPLKADGNKIIKDSEIKNQFLIPSVKLDKIFVDGECSNKYEKISPVSIQYPNSYIINKKIVDIHVNPQRLVNIKRTLVDIDESRIINISETNTEFYGIKNNFGTFLNKTNTNKTDYITYGNGIKISTEVAKKYDFILALTYQFGNTKTEGKLYRSSIDYTEANNSLYIGTIPEDKDIGVFMGGLCLSEANQEYSFNRENGYLNFNTSSELDTAVILFDKKQEGSLSVYNTEKQMYEIDLLDEFKKPLVFVSGIGIYEDLEEFEYDKSKNKLYIKNAKKDMPFSVFESNDKYVETGVVGKSNTIKYDLKRINFEKQEEPIVFINGLFIPASEILDDNGTISIYGLKQGMEYNILKNKVTIDDLGNRSSDIVFGGIVKYVTIPTYDSSEALVYIQGKILNNASCVIKTIEPISAHENQIIKHIDEDSITWKIYKNGNWNNIIDKEKIKKLDKSIIGYLKDEDSIHIMPVLEDENKIAQCDIFGYKFANTIEKPLLSGRFKLKDNLVPEEGSYNYNLQYNHYYLPRTNSMSVWINGLRQYVTKDVSTNTIGLLSNPNSLPSNTIKDHEAFYLLERPEYGESKSCERVIATKVPNCRNIYTTNDVSMTPGNIKVFVGGLRQPKEAYALLDDFTLLLKGEIMDNKEVIEGKEELVKNLIVRDPVTNEIVSYKKIKQTQEDTILIEIRQDYKISEITIEPRIINQTEFTCKYDKIPESLLESKDSVIYYINGVCYGVAEIDKKNMKVLIAENFKNNRDVIREELEPLLETYGSKFSKSSPKKELTQFDEVFIRYRRNQGMSKQEAENIIISDNILYDNYKRRKDKITFEWR